jgi:hypothetical protein
MQRSIPRLCSSAIQRLRVEVIFRLIAKALKGEAAKVLLSNPVPISANQCPSAVNRLLLPSAFISGLSVAFSYNPPSFCFQEPNDAR